MDGNGGLDDTAQSIQADQKARPACVLVESDGAWCAAPKEGEKVVAENDSPGFYRDAHELDDRIPWGVGNEILDPGLFGQSRPF